MVLHRAAIIITFTMNSFDMRLRGYGLMTVPCKPICTMRAVVKRLDTITTWFGIKHGISQRVYESTYIRNNCHFPNEPRLWFPLFSSSTCSRRESLATTGTSCFHGAGRHSCHPTTSKHWRKWWVIMNISLLKLTQNSQTVPETHGNSMGLISILYSWT